MLQPHAAVAHNPVLAARTLADVPVGLPTGNIVRFDAISTGPVNNNGDFVLDVLVNGVSIWAADLTQRPKILSGQSAVHVTGLGVAVVVGDIITVRAATVPAGGVGGVLALIVGIDDGAVSGTTRGDVVLTTASLADLATETGTVALGKKFDLLSATADRPCRVRLYTNAAARAADAARPAGTDPDLSTNHGVICDLVFQTGHLFIETINVAGQNMDVTTVSNIYYSVINLSGSAHTVQITFTRQETEV
jgi:hypothetical protein